MCRMDGISEPKSLCSRFLFYKGFNGLHSLRLLLLRGNRSREIALLGTVIAELGVRLHHALHDIDEVPENLHTSHAVEVGRAGQLFLQSKDQGIGQGLDVSSGVSLIGSHAAQVVAAYFAAAFHNHPEIAFILIVAADQVGNGGAMGDGTVAVAELPVIKTLEAGMGVVVGDGKGIDKGVGGLNGFA